MDGGVSASARPTRRGRRPWHVWTLFVRESGDLGFGQWRNTAGPHREDEESKPMMHELEKSDFAIVATKPANKAGGIAHPPPGSIENMFIKGLSIQADSEPILSILERSAWGGIRGHVLK